VLSRIGSGSRVVLTHDIAQRDNLRVGRHDGVIAVIEKLKGHPLFAHVTLVRSERPQIAALVTEMLEDCRLVLPRRPHPQALHKGQYGVVIRAIRQMCPAHGGRRGLSWRRPCGCLLR